MMKPGAIAICVFLTGVIILSCTLYAQGVIDLSSDKLSLTSKSNSLSATDYRPLHVSHLFRDSTYRQTLVERTQLYRPDVYQQMISSPPQPDQHRLVVGERKNFFVTNFQLQSYDQVTAELRVSSPKANIYVEIGELSSGHVTSSQIDSIMLFLTQKVPDITSSAEGIITVEQKTFGYPPNKDGDSTLDILIYDITDGFNGTGGYVAGYFSPVDQSDASGSNRRDIIYLDSYPTLYPLRDFSLLVAIETAAHEYQHLIHYRYDPAETLFINEGSSMFAEILFRFVPLDVANFFKNTNISLFQWPGSKQNPLDDFTRAQYFIYYLEKQFGISFIKLLIQNPLTGMAGLTDALQQSGLNITAIDVFESWCVANEANNSTINYPYGYGGNTLESKPVPIRSFYSESTALVTDSVNAFASVYLSFKNVGYFTAYFSGSPELKIYAVGFSNTSLVASSVLQIPINTATPINGIYPEIVFVVVNTSQSGSAAFRYQMFSNSLTTEIKYDHGIPDSITVDGKKYNYFSVGNSNAGGGAGYALAFDPPPNSTLVSAKYFLAFEQELPGSGIPEQTPRTFAAHIWKTDTNTRLPSINLIEAKRYTVDRTITPINSWFEISLTAWNQFLTNLLDTIFVGFTDDDNWATSVGLTQLPQSGSHSYLFTGRNWEELNSIKKNSWYSFNKLSSGFTPVSWINLDIMIRTVWKQRITDVTRTDVPQTFALEQNYPNPFSDRTTIRFVITEPTTVTLTVFDMLGRKVSELVNARYDEGAYITEWDGISDGGKPVANGTYLYRLAAGKMQFTKKMILSR